MSTARTSPQTLNLRVGQMELAGKCPSDSISVNGSEHAGAQAIAGVNSTDLLRGQKAVTIEHNGSTYRLQATRLGKLILTK